jgi:hypothetical protein
MEPLISFNLLTVDMSITLLLPKRILLSYRYSITVKDKFNKSYKSCRKEIILKSLITRNYLVSMLIWSTNMVVSTVQGSPLDSNKDASLTNRSLSLITLVIMIKRNQSLVRWWLVLIPRLSDTREDSSNTWELTVLLTTSNPIYSWFHLNLFLDKTVTLT